MCTKRERVVRFSALAAVTAARGTAGPAGGRAAGRLLRAGWDRGSVPRPLPSGSSVLSVVTTRKL